MRRVGFTLIEMVMVIVILGIVSMIGSDVISKMFRGHINAKITNDLEQKSDIVIDQIAKRLRNAIRPSIIARNSGDDRYKYLTDENLSGISPDMIEWLGRDYESFMGDPSDSNKPGWSGFIDVNSSQTTKKSFYTPGSKLSYASDVIESLSDNSTSLDDVNKRYPALVFKCAMSRDDNKSKWGWDHDRSAYPNDTNNTLVVKRRGEDILDIVSITGRGGIVLDQRNYLKQVCEQYYLTWSAYAIIPDRTGGNKHDFKLVLKYNYQPWYGDTYDDAKGEAILAEHVSAFRVRAFMDNIRIKVCLNDGNVTGTKLGFCKEKVLY